MIVGVVGKIAAGKTTVAEFFEKKGFCRVSCSDPLIDLLTHNVSDYSWIPELPGKAEPTREKLIEFGKYLKDRYGGDVLIRLAVDKKRHCRNIVIDGVRSKEEIEAIKRMGGKVIYVEARPEIRFERLMGRKASKDRTIRGFEDFRAMDEAEEKLYRTSELKEMADYIIVNEGTLEELMREVEGIIKDIAGKV
ncbi:AAA family ATPase [Thermococcus zilligii]|uniref:AAA family ATPase n=1 Tax=Thermococcus zilligii TaxID=54076 RepID=UPI00029A8C12|nr:AAA family ATPase [Thermococcus zilligii]